jgi:3-hydroxy-9,10-secoandrosta-1,3,5(10)-triene-9,17-dione monooxygenase reductase component
MTASDLTAGMAGVLDDATRRNLASLIERGLVQVCANGDEPTEATYELTEAGRRCALRLISAAKAVESQVLERMGAADAPVLKSLLNRLLSVIDPAAAVLWEDPGEDSDNKRAG